VIGTLVAKELRLTLVTFKFVGCSLLLVSLMAASTAVLTRDWRLRMDTYHTNVARAQRQLQAANAYADVAIELERRPGVLSLFNSGIGDRFGRAVTLLGRYGMPRISEGSGEEAGSGFLPIDFAHLVGVLISLIALVFSYDLINGDRVKGTLQMTLASSVPRSSVLFGKYLGTLASILAPFLVAALAWLGIVLFATGAEAPADIWVRLTLGALLSLLYASVFVWLGLLLSTLTARPATSLILGLLVWTAAVVVYPAAAMQIVALDRPARMLAVEPPHGSFQQDQAARARAEAALWEGYHRAYEQLRAAQALMRLSPLASYDLATAALAGTDIEHFMAFLGEARRGNDELRQWQARMAHEHPDRELMRTNLPLPLDLAGLTGLEEPFERLPQTVGRLLPDAALLVLFNVVLLTATLFAFRHYDIRL
jgi:ABC-type transport system involved in multi-copper enzyme maturation permease subunit